MKIKDKRLIGYSGDGLYDRFMFYVFIMIGCGAASIVIGFGIAIYLYGFEQFS